MTRGLVCDQLGISVRLTPSVPSGRPLASGPSRRPLASGPAGRPLASGPSGRPLASGPAARLAESLEVGLRQNPKRAQLLVSRLLGKHIPVPVSDVLAAAHSLGALVRAAAPGRRRW